MLACVDIDSKAETGLRLPQAEAAFGYTKISGKSLMVRGLNVLAATISTPLGAPVIAGAQLAAAARLRPRGGVVHH